MPTGVYFRTGETRRIASEALKGKRLSLEHKRKIGEGGKRYIQKHPEEREKRRERRIRYFQEHPEARKKVSENRKGHPVSEETRRKIKEARRKQKPPGLGKHHSLETKIKIREARKGKYGGANCPGWKGGRSFEPYSPSFNSALKRKVLKRDKYKCQQCGLGIGLFLPKKKLDVHHVDGDKQNCEMTNLVALCRSCHAKYQRLLERIGEGKEVSVVIEDGAVKS
jgi:hypothetical protein